MNHEAAWLYIKRLVDEQFMQCDAELTRYEELIRNKPEDALEVYPIAKARYEQIEQLVAIMNGIQDGDIDPTEGIQITVDPSAPSNQVDIRHPDGSLVGRIVNVGNGEDK